MENQKASRMSYFMGKMPKPLGTDVRAIGTQYRC